MTCDDYQHALEEGRGPDDPQLAAHRQACAACDARDTDLGAWLASEAGAPAADPEADALFAQLAGRVRSEHGARAWLRSRPTPVRRGAAMLAILALAGLVATLRSRPDLSVYPVDRLVLELGIFSVLAALLAATALAPALRVPRPGALAAILGAALVVPMVLFALPAAHAAHPAALEGAGADLAFRAWKCFAWGCAMGAVPGLLITFMARHDGPFPARDALAAAAAGLAGLLALQLHCPITHPVHLLAGHAPVVVGLVVAWMAVRRVAYASSRRPRT